MNRLLFNLTNSLWSIVSWFTQETRSRGILRGLLTLTIIIGLAFLGGWVFLPQDQFPRLMFSLAGLRFWVFPLVSLWSALYLAGRYTRDLYELPTTKLGMKYFRSNMYMTGLPLLEIEAGKIKNHPPQDNLLELVGGPGMLNIAPDSLVLLERMDGPSNVLSAGYRFVSRYETIKMVASLEDQHGYIAKSNATTKDGIEVTVREIRYNYRMRASRRSGEYLQREAANPFPFSAQALRNYAYNRTVSGVGLTPLTTYMNFTVDGVISEYIREHKFDRLTAPGFEDQDPREAIKQNFTSERTKERFRNIGMDLHWVDIGHFDVTDKVWKQRVENWSTRWIGTAHVEKATGEARRQAYREIGRVEAQSQLIIELAHQLNELRIQGGEEQGTHQLAELRRLILIYTAQMMDAMSEKPILPDSSLDP